jgi:hypothetical protein
MQERGLEWVGFVKLLDGVGWLAVLLGRFYDGSGVAIAFG